MNKEAEEMKRKADGLPHGDWICFNLPENCPCINVTFSEEAAKMMIDHFKAKPLYMNDHPGFFPKELFITYGGTQAPSQRRPEVEAEVRLASLRSRP